MRRAFGTIGAATGLAAALVMVLPGGGPAALAQDAAVGQDVAPPVRQAPNSFADLAESLTGTVVNISTSQRVTGSRGIPVPRVPDGSPFQEFFEDFFNREREGEGARRVQSLGSGFVIDPSGIIVTNNHVIADADEIVINFADDTKLPATVVGRDTKTDLAVLKVEPKAPLKAAPLGDSESLRIGDWVMAIGNPFGFGGTVTVGIVSALERDINAGPYDKFIQTDASINRGNSGGPLFNMNGEVIGINTAIISETGMSIGIGFAVPTDVAMPVIRQLTEFGETRRGWLGVRIQEVTDEIAESLGMERAMGALIAGVTEGGPAEKAGLEAGDIIVEFDGREVPSMDDLPRMVADTPVGKNVPLVVLRKGERQNLQVALGRLEESEQQLAARQEGETQPETQAPAADAGRILGMALQELTDELRQQYEIGPEVTGVLVNGVESGSLAEEKRVQAGDVIVEVGQEAVATPADVARRIEELTSEGRRSALFLMSGKNNDLRFVAIRIGDEQVGSGPSGDAPPTGDQPPDGDPPAAGEPGAETPAEPETLPQ